MTNKEFLLFHKDFCGKMHAVCKKKNKDYTGGSGDAFFNFSHVAHFNIATVNQGFLTRMLDKFCRLITFSNKGKLEVEDEGVEDTLLDLANYCIIMAGHIKSKNDPNVDEVLNIEAKAVKLNKEYIEMKCEDCKEVTLLYPRICSQCKHGVGNVNLS